MDRSMVLDHLALAERHVTEGEQHVNRQRELVAELRRKGKDTFLAQQVLQQFQELLHLHVTDRDRLRRELQEVSSTHVWAPR